jgi:perosamine synthetase
MKLQPNLIPRYNKDYKCSDLIYGIRSALAYKKPDVESLYHFFGKRDFFFTDNGRSSLYCILKSLNIPKNSKIGVPLYSCTVVFDAIVTAGHIPIFIDMDLHNYTMDLDDLKEKVASLNALIIIHTFGRPADFDKLRRIAGNIPIIEDCAHSLLSEYKGKITGTLGDASAFSLSKYVFSGGGGMILLNNKVIKSNLQGNINSLAKYSTFSELKHSFSTYLYSYIYHRPWYGLFAFSIGSYFFKEYDSKERKENISPYKIMKNDLGVYLNKIDSFKYKVEVQRKNSMILLDRLKDTNLYLPYEKEHTYCNYHLFPIRASGNKERDLISKNLTKMNVDNAKLWHMTPVLARKIYGYRGDCPNTEECAETLLTIPNYYTLNSNDLSKISLNVKKAVELL